MRTAEQVVKQINSARGDGGEQGLRNTAALLDMLQAWPECPVIHVAGTNGKGSVCAMLNSILVKAGYRTGMYTSPFLQKYNERIRISGTPVTDGMLVKYGNDTLDAAEITEKENKIHHIPFELGTVMAFHVFRQEKTEIIIMETGLGGRLDPTNVLQKPAVCAITAIGMDHMQILGHSLSAIAGEKAGIIKENTPVICYPADEKEVYDAFECAAEKLHAPLTVMKKEQAIIREMTARYSIADFRTQSRIREGIRLSLPGEHQVYNALVVLGIVDELIGKGTAIPEKAVREGLQDTFWPGRLEWKGNILMDGAHNAQGIRALTDFTGKYLQERKKVLLTGVLKEKITDEMLTRLSTAAEEAVTVTPESPRAMKAEELCELLKQKGMKATAANNLKEGLNKARKKAGAEGLILATGSLYFIGALRDELGLEP